MKNHRGPFVKAARKNQTPASGRSFAIEVDSTTGMHKCKSVICNVKI